MRPAKSLLGKVYCLSKPAVPVWVVLTILARAKGKSCFRIRRSLLGRACGICRPATISTALSALETLGIVKRRIRFQRHPNGTMFSSLSVTLKRVLDCDACTPCNESQKAHDAQRDGIICSRLEPNLRQTLGYNACAQFTESQNAHDLPSEDSTECANKASRIFSTLKSKSSSSPASSSAGVCASRTPAAATPAPTTPELNSSGAPNPVRAIPISPIIPASQQRRN